MHLFSKGRIGLSAYCMKVKVYLVKCVVSWNLSLEEGNEGGYSIADVQCYIHFRNQIFLYWQSVLLSAVFTSGILFMISFVITLDNLKLPVHGKVSICPYSFRKQYYNKKVRTPYYKWQIFQNIKFPERNGNQA